MKVVLMRNPPAGAIKIAFDVEEEIAKHRNYVADISADKIDDPIWKLEIAKHAEGNSVGPVMAAAKISNALSDGPAVAMYLGRYARKTRAVLIHQSTTDSKRLWRRAQMATAG